MHPRLRTRRPLAAGQLRVERAVGPWGAGEPENANIYEDEQLRTTGLIPYIERSTKERATASTPPFLYDSSGSGGQGRRRWLEASVYPVLDAEGSISEIVLVIEDVTEHKEAESKLREAEGRYRAVVENVPAVTYTQEVGEP